MTQRFRYGLSTALLVLSSVAIASGCSSSDDGDTGSVCNFDCMPAEPYIPSEIVPRIGRLTDNGFEEYEDGADVRVVSGGQGGQHIDIQLGFDETVDDAENFPHIRYRLRHPENNEVLASVDCTIGTVLAERPGATLVMISPRRLILPQSFPQVGTYDLEVDVVFSDCSVATVTKRVYLEKPFPDFPPQPPVYPYQRNSQ